MAVRSVCRAGLQLQCIRPAAARRTPRASGVAVIPQPPACSDLSIIPLWHSYHRPFYATMKNSFHKTGCRFTLHHSDKATSAFTFSQFPVSITYPFSEMRRSCIRIEKSKPLSQRCSSALFKIFITPLSKLFIFPSDLHSCKSHWNPAFLRVPTGILRADSHRYCPANTCSPCTEPPSQRRRRAHCEAH